MYLTSSKKKNLTITIKKLKQKNQILLQVAIIIFFQVLKKLLGLYSRLKGLDDVTLAIGSKNKRLETGDLLSWPHLALVTALSAIAAWGALIAVLQALLEGQSLAFHLLLATGLPTTPAALGIIAALLGIHRFASTAIFGFVVALSGPAHPCVLLTPSRDAVVPVVG